MQTPRYSWPFFHHFCGIRGGSFHAEAHEIHECITHPPSMLIVWPVMFFA
jgi:hypothetical protein